MALKNKFTNQTANHTLTTLDKEEYMTKAKKLQATHELISQIAKTGELQLAEEKLLAKRGW